MSRFSNVVSSLALFAALGGTATAAVALDRDSVGAPQIRADAVRSVEIKDESVKLRDLTTDARTVLESKLRVAEAPETQELPECLGNDETRCPPVLSRTLAPGSWLVQARLTAHSPDGTGGDDGDRCALVTAGTQLDTVRIGDTVPFRSAPVLSLLGVVEDVAGQPGRDRPLHARRLRGDRRVRREAHGARGRRRHRPLRPGR